MFVKDNNRFKASQWVSLLFVLLCSSALTAFEIRPFAGKEVEGDNVYAVWQFKPGAELADGKGKADLTLCGRSKVVPDPVFGNVLECFEYIKENGDKPHGAKVKIGLEPKVSGAFSIEAWVKLKENPDDPNWKSGYIIDKMYVPRKHESPNYNKDFYFKLRRSKADEVYLQAGIGLGTEVINFSSPNFVAKPGTWQLLAFHYDGVDTAMFFANGRLLNKQKSEKGGAMAIGRYTALSIGERCGSIHEGLCGYLAQLRIVKGLPSQVEHLNLELQHPYERYVFERMEQGQNLQLSINNLLNQKVKQLRLIIDDGVGRREQELADLNPNQPTEPIELPLPCEAKAGKYTYKVEVIGLNEDGEEVSGNGSFDYQICWRLPEFFPVVMWGSASTDKMLEVGFTHSLHWMDHLDGAAWSAGEPLGYSERLKDTRKALNEIMARGLRVMGKMSPGGYLQSQPAYAKAREEFLCWNRQGQPGKRVNFSLPRIQQHAYNAARSMANNFAMYPVMDHVLFDSEFRDGTTMSFRPEDMAALEKATGLKQVPKEIETKGGVKYIQLKDFPANRIIAEDNPILTYYRWFWGGADGYPGFISEARRGLNQDGKNSLKLLWDPVVRCPSKWGSGGQADLIGHWTYTYPDPLVMGLATDEVLAMHKGGPPHQQPTKMTQIIWYRNATTGRMPEDESKRAEWERRLPDAKFITIAPDFLEIALWQKLARAIKGIYYHGSGSLWDKGKPGGYDYTHPDTAKRLARLTKTVVKPLGPMLLKLPERKSEVALLESFTNEMFYGGSTGGNFSNPVGRMHGALVRAHYQPEVIYDETILRDGLEQFKVLVMPACAVLSEAVANRINDWQQKGGIIVGDHLLAPGISPDVLVKTLDDNEKANSIACAAQLRRELDEVLQPWAEADTPDAILRLRKFGGSDYLFAVNDRRDYGDYIGQYKKVMEKGLPLDSTIQLRRQKGTVYDLLQSQRVKASWKKGILSFKASFEGGQGRLYLITERPLRRIKMQVSKNMERNSSGELKISVLDSSGKPANAVLPLQISGQDSAGADIEISGYYAAVNGELTLPIDIAPNDLPGKWQLQVKDLASGLKAKASFKVR
ncbi:MAG: hypothetical protein GX927_08340 [Lentisphaerae bacterium]|nr:hypothetical protein [Lentisphaerota bacterium]